MANIYYLQPILAVIATSLHATPREVGYVSMALQVGYALGILAFVPLGDIVERRGLIVRLFAVTAVCLACAAAAPNLVLLALALCAVGITTTAPQILQPFAADLALPSERGRVLGTLQTGLIAGTVFARAVSGLLGAYVDWRAVFAFAAVLSAASTVVLLRVIPLHDRPIHLRYRDLFASMPAFIVALAPRARREARKIRHPEPERIAKALELLAGGTRFCDLGGTDHDRQHQEGDCS